MFCIARIKWTGYFSFHSSDDRVAATSFRVRTSTQSRLASPFFRMVFDDSRIHERRSVAVRPSGGPVPPIIGVRRPQATGPQAPVLSNCTIASPARKPTTRHERDFAGCSAKLLSDVRHVVRENS